MKLPKLRLKINLKPLLNYILIIVVSALFIASIFIALPLTEKYVSKATYNLNTKADSYWSKQYIISTENTDTKILNQTRDILFKRLKGFGVEEISTYIENDKVRVVITSSKNKEMTEELIKNRFDIQVMTRKSNIDFESSTDSYAYMLATNYDSTDWSRQDFRNIYITKLRNSSGTYSNFAIFKLWPSQLEKFDTFLKDHNGQYIGVSIDGFVTPHLVDTTSQVFAIPISTDDAQALKVMNLLYNSGVLPTNLKVDSEKDLAVNIPSVNYIQLTIGIFVAILMFYSYLFITKQTQPLILLKSLLATTLTISIYLSFLKIARIPIDTFLLPLETILVVIIAKVLSENKDSNFYIEIILLLTLTATIFLGNGFVSIIAQDMLMLTALTKLCMVISGWYINKIKKI